MIACGPNFHPALLALALAATGGAGLSIVLWLGALGVQLWQRAYGRGGDHGHGHGGGDGGSSGVVTMEPGLPWRTARVGLTWFAVSATAATVAGVLMS